MIETDSGRNNTVKESSPHLLFFLELLTWELSYLQLKLPFHSLRHSLSVLMGYDIHRDTFNSFSQLTVICMSLTCHLQMKFLGVRHKPFNNDKGRSKCYMGVKIYYLATAEIVQWKENSSLCVSISFFFSFKLGMSNLFIFLSLEKIMCLAAIYQNHMCALACAHMLVFCFAVLIHCLAHAYHNYPHSYASHGLGNQRQHY